MSHVHACPDLARSMQGALCRGPRGWLSPQRQANRSDRLCRDLSECHSSGIRCSATGFQKCCPTTRGSLRRHLTVNTLLRATRRRRRVWNTLAVFDVRGGCPARARAVAGFGVSCSQSECVHSDEIAWRRIRSHARTLICSSKLLVLHCVIILLLRAQLRGAPASRSRPRSRTSSGEPD